MARTPRRSVIMVRLAVLFLVGACTEARTTEPGDQSRPPAPRFDLGPAFDIYSFSPFTVDDAGANDTPAQTDMNAFARADNISGTVAVLWTWDDINSWSGTGQTGDACALFDTDNPGNGNADYAVCARITNQADGSVVQLPAGQSPQIYACSDKKGDRCSQPNPPPLPLLDTQCDITLTDNGFDPNGEDGADVLAGCIIDLDAIGSPTNTNLLNVCSFPSGAPNSNPFDCVVTPGVGFLQIVKQTIPDSSNATFNFTLSPAASDGTTSTQLTDDGSNDEATGLIPVAPGSYKVAEVSLPTGWVLNTASCLTGASPPVATGTRVGDTIRSVTVSVGETTICTFDNVVAAPSITVVKSVDQDTVPETGDTVEFTVQVTNNSVLPVSLNTLVDNVFGSLQAKGTCTTGGTIQPDSTFTCKFSELLPPGAGGSSHVDTVRAHVGNAADTISASDSARVVYRDILPSISVIKSAAPDTVPETGDTVTFTVAVTNNALEAVVLDSIFDTVFGDLAGVGGCAVGGSIEPDSTYSCEFKKKLTGNAGTAHVDTVTAFASDDEGSDTQASDSAKVTFRNVGPDVNVTKTASPTTARETGDTITFTVDVKNDGAEPVEITSLVDDVFGNLNGVGSCAIGDTIAVGATYSCAFKRLLSGEAATTHVDTVTATVKDNDESTDSDSDDATVTFTDVLPDISVTKTADPDTLGSAGGGGLGSFTPDRTYTGDDVPPTPGQPQFSSPTCDDAGPNDVPAQVDLNCFNRADNVTGELNVKWSWDDINSWTGTGQTGDGCALLDTDGDGNANVAICARITNTADGSQVVQVGGSGAADVYVCNDTKTDRCAKQVSKLTNILTTTCTIDGSADEAFPGAGDDGADVEATCVIDLAMAPLVGKANIELLNVCSFPSGEPNSNPFDCVVRPGAGFIQIVKLVDPTSDELFGFVLAPASTDGTNEYAVEGGVTSGLIPVLPGNGYSLKEILPAPWQLDDAYCVVGSDTVGTFNAAKDSIGGIVVRRGQTTTCTFENSASISGNVTFTIVVTNNSLEAVSLFSLDDDQFLNLDGVGSCDIGGAIAAKGTYTCSFTKTLSGNAGDEHNNEVTAVGKDNENNSDTAKDTAKVVFIGPST